MTDYPKRRSGKKAETKKESGQHAPRRPAKSSRSDHTRQRTARQDRRRKRPADRIRFAVKGATSAAAEQTVTGKTAQVLRLLIQRGAQGLTQHNTYPWHTRLAATVKTLRERGLDIETVMEPHSDGRHARYVLLTALLVLEDWPNGKR